MVEVTEQLHFTECTLSLHQIRECLGDLLDGDLLLRLKILGRATEYPTTYPLDVSAALQYCTSRTELRGSIRAPRSMLCLSFVARHHAAYHTTPYAPVP